MNIINSLPEWALNFIFPISSLLALALLVVVFRRINISKNPDHYDADILDTATQNSLSAAYVILGFTLVLVMGTADTVDNNLVVEANRIESLDRLLYIEGSKQAKVLRQDLKSYTQSIINDEWPLLIKGEGSEKTGQQLQKILNEIRHLNPTDLKSVTLFSNITIKADEMALSRQTRILASKSSLPPLFWDTSYAMLFGVLIIAALRLTKTTPLRAITLCVQVSLLALICSNVMIIDKPFRGDTQATNEVFIKVIQYMDKEDERIN